VVVVAFAVRASTGFRVVELSVLCAAAPPTNAAAKKRRRQAGGVAVALSARAVGFSALGRAGRAHLEPWGAAS
jgi:hypothetical protein